MPLPSYRVLSPVYIRPQSSVRLEAKKIAPEEHKSMQGEAPTVGSYGHASNTVIFRGGEAVTVTSNNKFATTAKDYLRNGPVTQIDDYYFGRWVQNGNENRPNSEWNKPTMLGKESSVITSLGERKAQFDKRDTPIPKYVTETYVKGPNNMLGTGLSRIQSSVKQRLANYLRTHDGKELASYLSSSGLSPEDIWYAGTGNLPERAIYGVSRLHGKVILEAAGDAYTKIVRDSKFLGVKPEDLLDSILAEEIAHIWRGDIDKDGDSIGIEIATKELVARHYERLAKGADGDPKKAGLKRRYQNLAGVKRLDAKTTPQRYGKKGSYKELYSKDRASLELMLELDAMEEGYRGEKVREYVARHLKGIGEEAEGKEKSKLERIADNESPQESESPA